MKLELPPLDYTPPPSGDVEHFRLALRRAVARTNEKDDLRTASLERLRDKQRVTFSDRYPLREYISSESCDPSPGEANEELEPRGAGDIDSRDTNKEVEL